MKFPEAIAIMRVPNGGRDLKRGGSKAPWRGHQPLWCLCLVRATPRVWKRIKWLGVPYVKPVPAEAVYLSCQAEAKKRNIRCLYLIGKDVPTNFSDLELLSFVEV